MPQEVLPEVLALLCSSLFLGTMFSRTMVELLDAYYEAQGLHGRRSRRWR